MTWQDVASINITRYGGIEIHLGWVIVALAFLVITYSAVRRGVPLFDTFEIVQADVKLGDIGSITVKPSYEDVQIAYRAWVELSTRKAALAFDEENDVIVEVYDSWYELFARMRELAKQIPAQKLRSDKNSREIVRLLVVALNGGLRPHLSRWQAEFRRWYGNRLAEDKETSPQRIQRQFPQYHELVADLRRVNAQILEYADVLKRISHGQANAE
jgi:hypothetical protein